MMSIGSTARLHVHVGHLINRLIAEKLKILSSPDLQFSVKENRLHGLILEIGVRISTCTQLLINARELMIALQGTVVFD